MPPPADESPPEKRLEEIVQKLGLYPIDAFVFVRQGLAYTVKKVHGEQGKDLPKESRHISGQDLCEGLRELALRRWGMMARAVLARWGVNCTLDFGRMVFAMIESGEMQKTEQDSLEDFRNVYDFKTAFDSGYKIEHK